MLIPFQQQVVKMALRQDLLLSEEQKDFITAMFNIEGKQGSQRDTLSQVAMNFVMAKQGGAATAGAGQNYNKIMESFETL